MHKIMIQDYLKKYNFSLSDEEITKFEKLLVIFQEKNAKINLSSIRNEESIIEKHFIDSLFLTNFIELKWKIADIWTWWWFPLIPLAIVDKTENSMFYGIDSIDKKLKAVLDFSNTLRLKNIITIQSRFEELWRDKNHRESFDFVLSRATAYFPSLLEYAIPLLKVWWTFIAYKLINDEEILEWKLALKELNSEIIDIKKYNLWWTDRCLIFIRKNKKTSNLYPRNIWIVKINPII